MPEFLSPIDIGSCAAEACGQPRLDPTLGFADPSSKAASEIGFVYGKARRAELLRNNWRFATFLACLRPLDTNTLLVVPTLWVSTTTYFAGSIVSDENGTLWESAIVNNLGNQPGILTSLSTWQPYFGPMTAALYDSSQAYSSSELVYTAAGDGTYNVWRSLINGNAVHPALSNQWAATTVYFKNQVVQQFPAYASGTTYAQGAGVLYTDGNVYASLTNSNTGHTPPTSSTNWILLPVLILQTQGVPIIGGNIVSLPTSSPVLEWAQGTTYSLGAAVMFNGSEWLSLQNNSTGQFPNVSGSTYWVAVSGGILSMSLIDINLGNSPSSVPAAWASGTTYATGATATGSDGVIYTSNSNGNVGNDPTLNPTYWTSTNTLCPWTTVFTQGGGNDQWTQIGGSSFPSGVALASLNLNWPIGVGPAWDSSTRNMFRLPSGYLDKAPQNPKAGAVSWLGMPGNPVQDDWLLMGNYLVSATSSPITMRFIADVQDVTQFGDMFCVGLGLSIAEMVCETITNSTAKLASIRVRYKDKMGEARTKNAIEVGYEEPPLEDMIACRF
jgi:hypothetical protein